jgi:hypothetical protein
MIRILYNILTIILMFAFFSCNEEKMANIIELKIDMCSIDTLDGLEFAYRVKVDNNSNEKINFYTGLTENEKPAKDGFYLKLNKIGKTYQMTALVKNGILVLPSKSKNNEFIIDVCFREYCKYISDFSTIYDAYYTSINKSDIIKEIIKDISIEYRVNNLFDDRNYKLAFKKDSVFYFKHTDSIQTNLYTEITGETISKMLKK